MALAAPRIPETRAWPKAELHCHLDGSVRPESLATLRRERRLPKAPTPAPGGGSLEAYLAAFPPVIEALQDAEALERVAAELAEDARLDGIWWLEVRFAPLLHTRLGLTPRQATEAVLRGLRRVPLELGVGVISCALRDHGLEEAWQTVRVAAELQARGVVGVDLAGPEASFPPAPFAAPFAWAQDAGLGVTLHAGEAAGPASIRDALEACGATRIGHGVTLEADPELLAAVVERGIVLEMCPRSNVETGAVAALAAHPWRRYLARGVRATLATDNRAVSRTTLSAELESVEPTLDELAALLRNGFEGAFASPQVRERGVDAVAAHRGRQDG
jgi:adenosine deaminase